MDAYINTKLMTFELPDGTIFEKESTKNYKFLLVYKCNPSYTIEGCYKTKSSVNKRIEYLKHIGWPVEFEIINRKSMEYIYRDGG